MLTSRELPVKKRKNNSHRTGVLQLIGSPRMLPGAPRVLKVDRSILLLTHLALQHNWVHRESLCGLLYPDLEPEVARPRLRHLLYHIRSQKLAPLLESSGDWLRWQQGSDLHLLQKAIREQNHLEVYRLYHADLLEGWSDPASPLGSQLLLKRSDFQQHWEHSALQAALQLLNQKQIHQASQVLQTLLKRNPLHEAALQQLLSLFVFTGEQEKARECSLRYQAHLRNESAVTPSAPLTAAFEHLQLSLNSAPQKNSQNMIPSPYAVLLGRNTELKRLSALLGDPSVQLVSIVGLGGMGKTTLALELLQNTQHQVLFVSCAAVNKESSLQKHLMDLLQCPEPPGSLSIPGIFQALSGTPLLLVLDGAEHMLDQVCSLLDRLQHLTAVRVVVTARRRLGLGHEHVLQLHGLPCSSQNCNQNATKRPGAAAQLFLRTLQQNGFPVPKHPAEIDLIESICNQVAGSPLAIQSAATWSRGHSLPAIQLKLEAGFECSDHPVSANLRDVFVNTCKLLAAETRTVLPGLAALRGKFDLRLAQHATGAEPRHLLELHDHALLLPADDPGNFVLHPLIQPFALEQLKQHPQDFLQVQDHLLQKLVTTPAVNWWSALRSGCQPAPSDRRSWSLDALEGTASERHSEEEKVGP